MTTSRPDPRLLAAARLVENLAHKLPAVRTHIRRQIDSIDGTSGGSDAPKVQASAELTTVEAAAARRIKLSDKLDDLEDRARAIAMIAGIGCNDADKILGLRITAPRCDATGRDGYLEPRDEGGWSDLDCHEIPRYGDTGLCVACERREQRWRREHGLPDRRSDAA